MTHTHDRRRFRINPKVKSFIRFLLEYGWLVYGLSFLVSIFVRTGMGWLAFPALLIWSLDINRSKTSSGGEFLKDLLFHTPMWLLQHGTLLVAMTTLLRTNWSGLSVLALTICITGPALTFFQVARWYLARIDKLAVIAAEARVEVVE